MNHPVYFLLCAVFGLKGCQTDENGFFSSNGSGSLIRACVKIDIEHLRRVRLFDTLVIFNASLKSLKATEHHQKMFKWFQLDVIYILAFV